MLKMRFLKYLFLGLLSVASAAVALQRDCYRSVAEVRSKPDAYLTKATRMRAYLILTDHGAYLADRPNDSDVLSVRFPRTGPHAESAKALLHRLRVLGVGKPSSEVRSIFEGQVTVDAVTGKPRFEIFLDFCESAKEDSSTQRLNSKCARE